MLDTISESQKTALQLRGSLFTLSVLHLQTHCLKSIENELKLMIRQAPKFFDSAPIVVDLQLLNDIENLDLKAITKCLRKNGMIPIGVRGGSSSQQESAKALGLAVMSVAKQDEPQLATKPKKTTAKSRPPEEPEEILTNNIIITKPVRSGQQIYAKGGDLIVIGPVSHGAELLADGSIHVYGPLRGRALAGINGNTKARIFCSRMDADLISIAGRYIVNEALIKTNEDRPQQVALTDEGKLAIIPL